MRNGTRYDSIYSRLVANTEEPENNQACWVWKASLDRSYYGRLNLYVPGLKRKVRLMAHVVMWLVVQQRIDNADDLYLAYIELRASGLEIDHLCHNGSCCSPQHLDNEPVTKSENCRRRRSKG